MKQPSLVDLAILRRAKEQAKDPFVPPTKKVKQFRVRWVPTVSYYRCGWYRGQLRKVTRYVRIEEAV